MLSDKDLKEDKAHIQEEILKLEKSMAQVQQQLNIWQQQMVRYQGALGYIEDNLRKEEGKNDRQ